MMIKARVVRCFMEEINQVEASYWTLSILVIFKYKLKSPPTGAICLSVYPS